jgi:deazaflavin-dependent oxidoreductase (nitroreductase family)
MRTPSTDAEYPDSSPVYTYCGNAHQPAPSGRAGRSAERVRLVRYTPAAALQLPYLRLHQFLYRHSGGLIGSRGIAGRALLLTTTGRRSGEPRTCALIYLKDGERLVVVASNGGSDHPPAWLLNLQADPHVEVQIGRRKFPARASVASAEERERLWPRVNRHNMGLAPLMHLGARGRYDVYQRHTTRVIPLVLLVRRTE